ncbi:ABC transporter permease [Butyrivibrio sp. WCD3002]|uniref:ABC transporter permease n=1 Tax=Butyrivibrio sp. WCD3002 TaxID=1280676 RepID=UPI000688A236|nr:ABC transporter permease subunit [Butyrivibrio sp. WCD3002]
MKKSFRKRFFSKWQLIVMFLIPFIWYIVFCYVPMYGIQLAFRNYNPRLGYLGSPWVGLRYFKQFFSSYYNIDIIWNTVSISLYSIIFGFPIPILLAIILNELPGVHFKKVLQNLTYVPHFISVVVLCGMLYLFLSPQYGVLNTFLNFLGFESIGFLESNKYFKAVYVLSDIWQESGWNSVIYIAALAGIDPELYEAAKIDGAGRLKRIIHVSLPGIAPTIVTLLILRIGQVMTIGFEKAYLLQNNLNIRSSEIISTLVYKQGILQGSYGYATAVGLFNSVINLALIILTNRICKKYFEISLW